jgi:hypothetical protein
MANKSKAEMLITLRGLVREALTLRHEGAVHARASKANGAADGYMRAILDAGLAEQRELLALVADERARLGGPATRTLPSDPAIMAA